jgi:hypothetical protein
MKPYWVHEQRRLRDAAIHLMLLDDRGNHWSRLAFEALSRPAVDGRCSTVGGQTTDAKATFKQGEQAVVIPTGTGCHTDQRTGPANRSSLDWRIEAVQPIWSLT